MKKTSSMKHIERIYEKPIEEVLRKMYVEDELSIRQIGRELGITHKTIWQWLKMCDITARQMTWK